MTSTNQSTWSRSAVQDLFQCARGRIPEPHSLILRAGHLQPAVKWEGYRVNLAGMALERLTGILFAVIGTTFPVTLMYGQNPSMLDLPCDPFMQSLE
ncbi:hypothetical protein AFLA_000230 [Aspergillus flavus NRRL3357]|nr:hypothetical protein AFLA_000230 [Aspergillus flavus NRRL3357]